MFEHYLINCKALFRIFLSTAINEVLEGVTEARGDSGYRVMNDGMKQLASLCNFCKGRAASRQLVSQAAKGPNIDFLRVADTLCNLWADPVWCTKLCLPILLLLRQETTEAEVSDFDSAEAIAQDVIRLDVPMENISPVHTIESNRNFVEDVLTEGFRVYGVSCKNDISERSFRHIVKEYPNAIVVLKEINALDDLFTFEVSD